MSKFYYFLVLVLLSLNISCYKKENNVSTDNEISAEPVKESQKMLAPNKEEDITTTLHFKEFTANLTNFIHFYDEAYPIPALINKDTITIDAEPGNYLKESILIISKELINVKVSQQYKTSMLISHEDVGCEMSEWKHYISEWKTLKSISPNNFLCEKYSNKDFEKFPNISLQELKEAVKEHCGELIAEEIKNIKSPYVYPAEIGVSRFYLKITGTEQKTGKSIIKVIIITIPSSC